MLSLCLHPCRLFFLDALQFVNTAADVGVVSLTRSASLRHVRHKLVGSGPAHARQLHHAAVLEVDQRRLVVARLLDVRAALRDLFQYLLPVR